jgi:DNA-binding transcriptional ArsR family regulator
MVEYRGVALDRVFAAIADPTRREILEMLRAKPATITRIARAFPVSLNAVSKHVKVLEGAGLVRREVSGREHRCSLSAERLRDASQWIEHYRQFWEMRLDALERHLVNRKRRQHGKRSAGEC